MDNQALKTYIEKSISRGSSATELARKCGISDTAAFQFRSDKYGTNEDSIAEGVAPGLNYYENAWNVVEGVTNYQQVYTALIAAKKNHKWMCISSCSGNGRTQPPIDFYNMSTDSSVIYLKCRKWMARKLLIKLAARMGETITCHMNNDDLTDSIVSHTNHMAGRSPLLILDDAGELAHNTLCMLMLLCDDTLHRMGTIIAGTETLEHNIKYYVSRIEGHGEIDGKSCRNYITLLRVIKEGVKVICTANGINSTEEQETIQDKLNKEKKEPVAGKSAWFTDDLHELSGMTEDHIIEQQIEHGGLA